MGQIIGFFSLENIGGGKREQAYFSSYVDGDATAETPEAAATATQAAKTPLALVGVIAGLAAGCVMVLRRRE